VHRTALTALIQLRGAFATLGVAAFFRDLLLSFEALYTFTEKPSTVYAQNRFYYQPAYPNEPRPFAVIIRTPNDLLALLSGQSLSQALLVRIHKAIEQTPELAFGPPPKKDRRLMRMAE
jgi:hypothetical protein